MATPEQAQPTQQPITTTKIGISGKLTVSIEKYQ